MSCEHTNTSYSIATQIDTCHDCGAFKLLENEWVIPTIAIPQKRYAELLEIEDSFEMLRRAVKRLKD